MRDGIWDVCASARPDCSSIGSWAWGLRLNNGSRMSCEVHVRFCEGLAGKFRRSTLLIAHCVSRRQAEWLRAKIEERLSHCGLELHPQKTRVVYCKDDARKDVHQNESFDFLGYTFRQRSAKRRTGGYFVNFCPAISGKASKEICRVMRSWRIHRCSGMSLDEISRFCNPILRGWINYYGQYYKSALHRVFRIFNYILVRWAMKKYRRFKFHKTRAAHWLHDIALRQPVLFAHWQMGSRP